MAERRPLVLIGGGVRELPDGDEIPGGGGMQVCTHGSDADTARPSSASQVLWIGSIEPNNAVTNDIWVQA